jgi:hypothetical protein
MTVDVHPGCPWDFSAETLNEEKEADQKLSALAEGGVNQEAASGAHAGQEDEDAEQVDVATASAGSGRGQRANGSNNRSKASQSKGGRR